MEELIEELRDLQNKSFILNMSDHWDYEDYRTSNEWHDRMRAIEAELKEKYGWEEEEI